MFMSFVRTAEKSEIKFLVPIGLPMYEVPM